MTLALLAFAAAAYSAGGVFMKLSRGLTVAQPAAAVFACFIAGAAAQAVAMRRTEMGANYLAVLGLEAGMSLAFSVYWFGEEVTGAKIVAVFFILAGVGMLRFAESL